MHEIANQKVMNSLPLCSLHPLENVVLCSCSNELSQPDNCFPSSARFAVIYKYFFDMFSGILPQNSVTVTVSFWKQSNRSIRKKCIFDSFSLKKQNVSPISEISMLVPLLSETESF